MNLIIVESPTKARTISRFVGKDYRVASSFGHVRDLPTSKLAVDVEHDFAPQYITPQKARPVVKELKGLLKKSHALILATDEDREGEAIAWHLTQALSPTKTEEKHGAHIPRTERIVFHEITKNAIAHALAHPRDINMRLVDAQQARRVLDRLVGYKLSPFLWKKIMRGLSAGRVQSVALRLIVEREKAIRAFVTETYWTIEALLKKTATVFPATLVAINDTAIPKPGMTQKSAVEAALNALAHASWRVGDVEQQALERHPAPPFTTSTLQQAAWQRLGFTAKKTMMTAQQLYEGVEIQGEGSTGLITYMRTDSLHVAQEALLAAQGTIAKRFGSQYSLLHPRHFKTKIKGAQEAHEAVRPTDPGRAPDEVRASCTTDQYRLYTLIWQRFLASQAQSAVFETVTATIIARAGTDIYTFRSKGSVLRFDGFLKIYAQKTEDTVLPPLVKHEALDAASITSEEHQTQPPSRYTEASLVKALETHGIGRPSTYAAIISTIQNRQYVEKNEQKRFVPTDVGITVTDLLLAHFPAVVDIAFTARMEADLDEIAEGKKEWQPVVRAFYEPFAKTLEEKYETVAKKDLSEPTDEICERCGKPMVQKQGRFGKFIACSGFPDCRNTKRLPPVTINLPCPTCGAKDDGEVVMRRARTGRMFYGCSRYPACNFATWKKPNGEQCPDCGAALVEERNKVVCSNKACAFKKEAS